MERIPDPRWLRIPKEELPRPPPIPSYFARLPKDLTREILQRLSDEDLVRLIQSGYKWLGDDVKFWEARGLKYYSGNPSLPWEQYMSQAINNKTMRRLLDDPFLREYAAATGYEKYIIKEAFKSEHPEAIAWLCETGRKPSRHWKPAFQIFAKHGYIPGFACLERISGKPTPWNDALLIAGYWNVDAVRRLLDVHEYKRTFILKVLLNAERRNPRFKVLREELGFGNL